jgi:hypothetical protein
MSKYGGDLLYERYDKEFQQRDAASETFRNSMAFIVSSIPEAVRKTRFRNKTWFYSLMVAVADAQVGIPNGKGPKEMRPPSELQKRMFYLDAQMRGPAPAPDLVRLQEALSRGTSHVPQREVRHEHFFDMLALPERAWLKKWEKSDAPQ